MERGQRKHGDTAITDAEENCGVSELRDALLKKSEFLVQIGDKDADAEAVRKTADDGAWDQDRLGVPHHQDWSLLHRPKHHQD